MAEARSDTKVFDRDHLLAWLQNCVSKSCGLPVEAIGLDDDFEQFGIDSVGVVGIVIELEDEAALDTELDPEILFELRTIRRVVKHVEDLRALEPGVA